VGVLADWIAALSNPTCGEMLWERWQLGDKLPMRRRYKIVRVGSENVSYLGRMLKKGEQLAIPDERADSVGGRYPPLPMFLTLRTDVYMTPSGLLCDLCLDSHYSVGYWRDSGPDRNKFCCSIHESSCVHDYSWPLPCVVQAWWREKEPELSLEKLEPYLANSRMTFNELASLLAVGAPWV